MHIYDYIIIGSGLTGLTIAQRISLETKNVLLLESLDEIGGSNKPATLADQTINNGLRFFPGTDYSIAALKHFEDQLGLSIIASVEENNPEYYEAHEFKSFLGFGEKSPEFYDQFSYFLSPRMIELNSQPYQWIQTLKDNFKGTVLTRSFVTKLGFEDLESKHPKLTHVIVNGKQTFYAHNFIFAAPAKELSFLMPDEILHVRAKNKLSKTKSWQAVCVDLYHPAASPGKSNLFILNGTTDDEIGPCVGRFISPDISQWLSFIDIEAAEDTENIGHVLKKVKKQMKRAFPDVAEKIQKERIFVSPPISGGELKLHANLSYPHVENLWIASAIAVTGPNLLGSLQTAQLILGALGFGPAIHKKAESEEIRPTDASI